MNRRDVTNPYMPAEGTSADKRLVRPASNVWSLVVPTVIACVIGTFLFRSYFVSVGDPTGASLAAGVVGFISLALTLLVRSAVRAVRAGGSCVPSGGIVADGRQRVRDGIEVEVRADVEDRCAEVWNASGLVKRWFLSRQIEREVADRVAESMKQVSPDSLH